MMRRKVGLKSIEIVALNGRFHDAGCIAAYNCRNCEKMLRQQ